MKADVNNKEFESESEKCRLVRFGKKVTILTLTTTKTLN